MAGSDLGGLLGGLLGGGGQGGGAQGGGGAGAVLGSLLGALMRGQGGSSAGAAPGSAAGAGNPLGGLLDLLTRSGLVDQAQSWIGSGQNKPVSGDEIARALPDETLRQVAQESGVSPQQAADEIARSLPQVVDKLTPNGQVPTESLEDIIRQQRL